MKDRSTYGLFIGSSSLLFIFILLLYKTSHPLLQFWFHFADALYLPILFQNIFEQQGHFKDWYLTPAPYFFPDYLFFFGAYSLGSTIALQMAWFAIIQVLALNILLYCLFKKFLNSLHAGLCAFFCTLLLLDLSLISIPFYPLLLSAFHYGSFLTQLACIVLLIEFLKSRNRLPLCGLCILTFVSTCSDAIFILQWTIPVFLSYLFFIRSPFYLSHLRRIDLQLSLPLFSSILGYLFYPKTVAHPTRYSNQLGWSHFFQNFHDIFTIFDKIFLAAPWTILYISLFYISIIVAISAFFYKRKTHHPLFGLLLFVFFSSLVTACTTSFITQFVPTDRYFIPMFSWPIMIGALCLPFLFKKYFRFVIVGCLLSVASHLSFTIFHFYQLNGLKANYLPEDMTCIDKALSKKPTLHHGIAQYWDAKPFQAYSQQKLKLAQYAGNLSKHCWITSSKWYREAYDFAIISLNASPDFKISQEKILASNRLTPEIVHCGQHDLLIYAKNELKIKQDYRYQ